MAHPALVAVVGTATFGIGAAAVWHLLHRPTSPTVRALPPSGAKQSAPDFSGVERATAAAARYRAPTLDQSPSASQAGYLDHLTNAAKAMQTIDEGAQTPEEAHAVDQAWADLSRPIDVLTAQKDLNVLGAEPPLVEDGVQGPKTTDAIDSFQGQMGLPVTGVMDVATSNALRRAVVAVTTQGSLT